MMPNETLAWLDGAIDRKQGPISRPPRGITRPVRRDPVQVSRCPSSGLKQAVLGRGGPLGGRLTVSPLAPALVLAFLTHIIGKELRGNGSKCLPFSRGNGTWRYGTVGTISLGRPFNLCNPPSREPSRDT